LNGNPKNPDVSAALGFWYRNTTSEAPALSTSGQVIPENLLEKTYNPSWRMLVNPFPVATKLSDINFGAILATSPKYDDNKNFRKTATATQIPFADREGFTTYYFLADGDENYVDPGWTDLNGNSVKEDQIIIPAGRVAWFKGNVELTLTFKK
jgi:hypothetical protein